ncbi:tetratricopeptide repeat protein [uncultured Polaribacter sp.]|uniref:type IX secretion system periplasmic lipoprotein PorW/SprE n=1 Tax=uncultured Polaribacter sp. TaxID=174711 RepID=UPI0026206D6E|nr:tetratricopeptide repeat protein [uncultured Polaribacter sp.]
MKFFKKIALIVILIVCILSCSTKKDALINRNYHVLTTKYNVLFNGKEAFNEGIESINKNYKDDWFNQLSIEPIKFEEEKIKAPRFGPRMGVGFGAPKDTKEATTPFDIAEEKAVKAIQTHGMNIEGKERNKQIDEAYLLLGKARYFDQRFIPAIEAFNYVIKNYPNASLINETKIWRAKANIRIDNEEFAIESMSLLLRVKDTFEVNLPDEIKEQGYTALAMAYVKADSIQKAKKCLIKATRTLNNVEQGERNLFVLSQIYNYENKKDSALLVLNKIINYKKTPYKYKIHANIELAKNSTNDSTSAAILKRMHKLIKERDNRAYLDELYYQVGFLHENNDSINLAVHYYNKSLKAKSDNVKQKTYTYERLGNINFKNSKYLIASSYYDSVINIAKDDKSLRIRRIKRKYKNLATLIRFEGVVKENDSILKLTSLSKTEQETFFTNYIENLKEKDKKAAQLKLNQEAFGPSFGGNSLQSTKKGKWYFYNSQSLGFGKTEFEKIWGKRKLADNWRWSSTSATSTPGLSNIKENQKNSRYDLENYIKKIPTDEKEIETLKIDRNQALYELGLIYKEQFKDPELAIARFERVATLNPKEKLILPINWHLYKIYKNLNNKNKENKHKEFILTKYPNTVFAKAIKNPNKKVTEEISISEIENKYKEIYYLYKENKYQETASKISGILPTIENSELIPKFELLRAYALGKYSDKETYKKALEAIVIKYGNSDEGKQAKKIVTQLSK